MSATAIATATAKTARVFIRPNPKLITDGQIYNASVYSDSAPRVRTSVILLGPASNGLNGQKAYRVQLGPAIYRATVESGPGEDIVFSFNQIRDKIVAA